MSTKIFGYTNSDTHLTKLKELILNEHHLFIDKFKNQFINTQYKTLKKILQKDDILYVSSLSDLGQTYQDILTEWIELTKNIQIYIIVLDLNTFIKNKIIENKNLQNINLLNELILEILYSLKSKNTIKQTTETSTEMLTKTSKIKNSISKHSSFPIQFVKAYHDWEKGNITLFTAMKNCKINGIHFYNLIKRYEKIQNK
ncbi:hypothetical protein [Bacillus cereus]|uniref:hypothetical protein n=1 Tax=Bacillus cereus TaxID=1396 RepID=UPI0018F56072|nr:hypothetical protein [Bacillus cereus]MBJ8025527.1 hypothetical protein [Bacillus cereus]MBJ8037945.1 hypothetical protein [Bacillus cereus]